MFPDATPPVLGQPSEAAGRSWPLRAVGGSAAGGPADADGAAYQADGGEAGPWSLRAASVAGVRHRLAGRGGQDAYAWTVAGDALVVAVADGVGSVAGSAAAAAAAVTAACAAAVAALGTDGGPAIPGRDGVLAGAVAAARHAVTATGGATTLVVAVATPDATCHLARVGDSTAVALEDGTWHDCFDPGAPVAATANGAEDEDLATTVTDALPHPTPELATVTVEVGPGRPVVLVTDGVAGPLRDGPTTMAPAFADALATPPAPLALAALVDFSRRGCHDDRTLLGLWRAGEPSEGEGSASDGPDAGWGDTTTE